MRGSQSGKTAGREWLMSHHYSSSCPSKKKNCIQSAYRASFLCILQNCFGKSKICIGQTMKAILKMQLCKYFTAQKWSVEVLILLMQTQLWAALNKLLLFILRKTPSISLSSFLPLPNCLSNKYEYFTFLMQTGGEISMVTKTNMTKGIESNFYLGIFRLSMQKSSYY